MLLNRSIALALALLVLSAWLPVAHADDREVASYALLIGTNAAGDGQQQLRYAEDDAKLVAGVIESLGQTPSEHIQLVLRPSRNELNDQLERLHERLAAREKRGLQSQLLVYYSGHARADSLVLGDEEYELSALRERLLALPSTLTVILLDACQSGAFSRVKGIETVEDFSVNSVKRLQSAGVAVMASSSATELSQESERLQSSYFTHHLVVGLRGAGDSDRDGRVTLSEAYRYAYNTTLVDTTKTRVGSQHVTLETDLKGKGEVVLTYPEKAGSRVVLPASLTGKVVIHHKQSGSVLAEVHKGTGSVSLALPSGAYVVLVREGSDIRRCNIILRDGQNFALEPSGCEAVKSEDVVLTKSPTRRRRRPWAVEMGVARVRSVLDDYTVGLEDDGYQGLGPDNHSRFSAALVMPFRFLQGVVEVTNLEGRSATRSSGEGLEQELSWSTLGVAVKLRLPVLTIRKRNQRWLGDISGQLFVEIGGGPAFARTKLDNPTVPSTTVKDTHIGYLTETALGFSVMFRERVGIYTRAGWIRAPIIDDGEGGKHDSGGLASTTGLRIAW